MIFGSAKSPPSASRANRVPAAAKNERSAQWRERAAETTRPLSAKPAVKLVAPTVCSDAIPVAPAPQPGGIRRWKRTAGRRRRSDNGHQADITATRGCGPPRVTSSPRRRPRRKDSTACVRVDHSAVQRFNCRGRWTAKAAETGRSRRMARSTASISSTFASARSRFRRRCSRCFRSTRPATPP